MLVLQVLAWVIGLYAAGAVLTTLTVFAIGWSELRRDLSRERDPQRRRDTARTLCKVFVCWPGCVLMMGVFTAIMLLQDHRQGWPILFVISVIGVIAGTVNLVNWLPRHWERNEPVVTGQVVAREPVSGLGRGKIDFTILVDQEDVIVHAVAPGYTRDKVPRDVRFHYSGGPSREVFLFELEEDPLWAAVFLWGMSVLLLAVTWYWWRSV